MHAQVGHGAQVRRSPRSVPLRICGAWQPHASTPPGPIKPTVSSNTARRFFATRQFSIFLYFTAKRQSPLFGSRQQGEHHLKNHPREVRSAPVLHCHVLYRGRGVSPGIWEAGKGSEKALLWTRLLCRSLCDR